MSIQTYPRILQVYVTENGKEPFTEWLTGLKDNRIRARIRRHLDRVQSGNLGDFKRIGQKLIELRLFFGSGYRIYCCEDGQNLIILLCGGNKHSQKQDIKKADEYLADYMNRKA